MCRANESTRIVRVSEWDPLPPSLLCCLCSFMRFARSDILNLRAQCTKGMSTYNILTLDHAYTNFSARASNSPRAHSKHTPLPHRLPSRQCVRSSDLFSTRWILSVTGTSLGDRLRSRPRGLDNMGEWMRSREHLSLANLNIAPRNGDTNSDPHYILSSSPLSIKPPISSPPPSASPRPRAQSS